MASHEVPKTCKVITADTIARGLLAEVKETLAKIQGPSPIQPTLVAFLANDDPAAVQYAQWSKKTCEEKYEALSHSLHLSLLPFFYFIYFFFLTSWFSSFG